MADSEYQQLSELEHILKFPHLNLGNSTVDTYDTYMLDMDKMWVFKDTIAYNQALERLYLEILYNAGDNAETSKVKGIDPGSIRVDISQDTIRVRNEGRPISCKVQPGTDMHIPEFIFSCLRVSSNYSSSRKVGSTHGQGAKLANIFSTYFFLDIGNKDEGTRYRQAWRNNTSSRGDPIITSYSGPSYTQITFTPDFGRFYDDDTSYGFTGKREFTLQMLMAYAKHAADVSFTAGVPVIFNGRDIMANDIVSYARLYYPTLPTYMVTETGDSICMFLDTPDGGQTISFVNGVLNSEGGIHTRSWKKVAYTPVHNHLKKYKVKDRDIDEHISCILACRLLRPKYKSQTKDYVTSPKPEVSLDTRVPLEWEGIKHLEDIMKSRQNAIAKRTDGSKKKVVNVPKLHDASCAGGNESDKCTLYITEGDSAANFAVKGISDGTYTGAMPIKGKLLNVGTADIQQYTANGEIAMLKQALGLKEGANYDSIQTLRYGRLVILSDQDVDGMHIRGLIYNFFRLKFPSLLDRGYVQVMETPLLRVKADRQEVSFYYQREYDEWVSEDPDRKRYNVSYYKGLGTSSDEELLEAFRVGKCVALEWDDMAETMMAISFDPGYEDDRKDLLMSWDSEARVSTHSGRFPMDTISHFVTNQLCEFSFVNTGRTIPSVVDGLKECQRKVLTVVMGMKKAKKVSQLKGEVSNLMHYKYGDDSLSQTIVGMGNYAVGTNNIPLIKAKGQYDSRLGVGTAAADRYIYASSSPILRKIFRPEDDIILDHRYEGTDKIEPTHYYPIIPMFAINGALGIGSGFSTRIPCYDPVVIMKWIVQWLKHNEGTAYPHQPESQDHTYQDTISPDIMGAAHPSYPEMVPWYRGYRGKIEKIGGRYYSIGSYEEVPSRKRFKDIRVTEIPVTQTIGTYLAKLDKLREKPIVKGDRTPWIKSYKSVPKKEVYTYKGERYIEILPNVIIEGALCVNTYEGGPLRALGLIEKISDTNITLLDSDDVPHIYKGGIHDAMDAYCVARYDAYVRRRRALMSMWKDAILKLRQKKAFIRDILDGTLVIKGRSKQAILDDMDEKGYHHEFLTKTSILTMTEDGIAKIDADIARLRDKYNTYRDTTPAQMWFQELEELFNAL